MQNELNPKEKSYVLLKETLRFIRFVLFLALIFWAVRSFVMQPFVVRGSSMEDTFSNGDYVIIEKLSYQWRDPKRGEVVVFNAGFTTATAGDNQFFIKRIVGLPGERVEIKSGNVVIYNKQYPDGRILREPYLENDIVTRSRKSSPQPSERLDANEYFVLGDNRANSSDSRIWGPLEEKDIVGKPVVRIYPFGNFTVFTGRTFQENIDT